MTVELMDRPLRIDVADNALATAFEYDPATTQIKGCVYDSNGDLISLSQRTSGVGGDRIVNSDSPRIENVTATIRIEHDCVYLGHLMGHYGHFLTETLSSFWALPLLRNHMVAF